MINFGIVGSRRRATPADRKVVFALVRRLLRRYGEIKLVSGGCPTGADRFAEEAADKYDVPILVHLPERTPPPRNRGEAVQRLFARNLKIAQSSRVLFALVAPDRTGGTENTIGHMQRLDRLVMVHLDKKWQKLAKPLPRSTKLTPRKD